MLLTQSGWGDWNLLATVLRYLGVLAAAGQQGHAA